MTREEAKVPVIAMIHMINGGATTFKNMDGTANVIIDQFVKLGMLKLDEPKSEFGQNPDLVDRLNTAIRDWQKDSPYVLSYHLNLAGIKIVEK